MSTQSESIVELRRRHADIEKFLDKQGLHHDSVKLSHCKPGAHCQSVFCLYCISYRASRNRSYLLETIPKLLDDDLDLELWFLTGMCADSADINTHARAAVRGMRKLLKHPHLVTRVQASFNALEVIPKTGQLPSAHVHTLIVTKQISRGRYRLSEATWIQMWERACDLPRLREDPQARMIRRNRNREKPNLSLVAVQVFRNHDDIRDSIGYVTKETHAHIVLDKYAHVLDHPDKFIERMTQLKGVTRFFGSLSKA